MFRQIYIRRDERTSNIHTERRENNYIRKDERTLMVRQIYIYERTLMFRRQVYIRREERTIIVHTERRENVKYTYGETREQLWFVKYRYGETREQLRIVKYMVRHRQIYIRKR